MQNLPRTNSFGAAVAALLIAVLWPGECRADPVRGKTGSTSKYYSGWIDLQRLTDFHRGDKLRLTMDQRIHNPAKEIYVRLLAKDGSPNDEDEGAGTHPVKGPVVEVVLDKDYPQTRQISVHGGPNPFGTQQLSPDNGTAKLISVDLTPAGGR
jgi:hypothetical protein